MQGFGKGRKVSWNPSLYGRHLSEHARSQFFSHNCSSRTIEVGAAEHCRSLHTVDSEPIWIVGCRDALKTIMLS